MSDFLAEFQNVFIKGMYMFIKVTLGQKNLKYDCNLYKL